MAALSRHQVLLATPISQAARQRLSTFFEVHTFEPTKATSQECWEETLTNMAGALVDAHCKLDGALLKRLPRLQAVASTATDAHHHLDIDALTRANVRATHGPIDASLSLLDAVWADVEAAVHRGGLFCSSNGYAPAQWGRSIRLGRPATACMLAFQGCGVLHDALLARARRTGMQYIDISMHPLTMPSTGTRLSRMPDLLVRTCDDCPPPGPATAYQILDVAHHAPRLRNLTAMAWSVSGRDMVIAEDLVASLGFGRNGWHPIHWLNPEVACTSCC
jgi:hypothetical protein